MQVGMIIATSNYHPRYRKMSCDPDGNPNILMYRGHASAFSDFRVSIRSFVSHMYLYTYYVFHVNESCGTRQDSI